VKATVRASTIAARGSMSVGITALRRGKRRIDEVFPHELRANTNEFILFKTGATWQVLGSDRYDTAVGSPPADITFSGWALSNAAAWAYLARARHALANRKDAAARVRVARKSWFVAQSGAHPQPPEAGSAILPLSRAVSATISMPLLRRCRRHNRSTRELGLRIVLGPNRLAPVQRRG
jgi:hypothetical protein